MFDYHIHTNNSHDSEAKMVDCAKIAQIKGLKEICFTDHHEIDYPIELEEKPYLDFDRYFENLDEVRAQIPDLSIKTGVETGLIPASLKKIADDLAKYEFDFIIASQHVVQGRDPWFGNFYEEWDLRQGQEMYLKELLYCIQNFENFDVVGHIGYVDKYLDKYPKLIDPQPFIYADFPDIIDSILNNLISRGKGIEINTSNYPVHGYPTPHPSIIRRYAELGGEILTTGSDSHSADAVGHEFENAYELLKKCGIKHVCTFTNRKPEFHKI